MNRSLNGNEPSNWFEGKRIWEFLYVNVELIEIQKVLTLHCTVLTATSAYWSQVLTWQGSVVIEIKPWHLNYTKKGYTLISVNIKPCKARTTLITKPTEIQHHILACSAPDYPDYSSSWLSGLQIIWRKSHDLFDCCRQMYFIAEILWDLKSGHQDLNYGSTT